MNNNIRPNSIIRRWDRGEGRGPGMACLRFRRWDRGEGRGPGMACLRFRRHPRLIESGPNGTRKFFAILLVAAAFLFSQNQAHAAVAFGTAGAVDTGSTSLDIPYPTGIVAGNLLVLAIGNKYPTNGPATPAGWTLVTNGQGSGGSGGPGDDSGTVYSTVFVKVADGTESGNLTVTLTSANSSMGRMFRYTNATGIWGYAATNGSDNSAGTSWSVTGAANPGITSGDMLVVVSAINSNAPAWSAEAVSAVGATFGTNSERQDSGSTTNNDMRLVVSDHTVTAGTATAAPVFTMTGSATAGNYPAGASVILRIRETPVTTLGNGAAPSTVTIAPGAAITDLDYFTLVTSAGTDTVTAVTVTLGPAGAFNNIAQVDLTDNSNVARCTAVPNPASNTITFTTCTSGGGIPVTTTATTYKVRITPKSHAAMPLPPGASYATTGTVTAFTSTNAQSGTDSTSATITVDNLSPSGATAVSGSAGATQVTLNWTTSASADFSRSVMLRWTGGTAGTEVPAEGTDYVNGDTITTATVVCVRTADAASTAVSGVDGAGSGGCSATALTTGQAYTYKIFQKDSNGNYDVGVAMGSFTPPVCWSDNFNRANGPPGADWIVSNSGGSFGDPVIFNNRLRMTDTAGNLATMAKLQRLFPGVGNRIEVEFEHFAYGGTGADGIAVTFSDSSVTPAPGAYGGSLGYAQRSSPSVVNGFAGGWLGVGIDEYGNFSNPTEGRQGGPGFFVDSVSIRGSGSGTTGYVYHAGTGTLAPQVDNNGAASPPHKYRIIVDHSNAVNAFVSVERNTGAGYVTLVAPYDAKAQAGQAAVPANWLLSYTGSSGGSTNIHEIDNLRICATSQMSLGVNHYELSLPTSSITCLPTTATVTACADSSSPCTNPYTAASGQTALLAASGGTLTPSTVTFNASGVANSTLSYPAAADGTAVTVTLSGEQTVATNPRKCCPNGVSCAVANFCSTTFNTAGIIFSNAADGVAWTIPTQTAGASSGTYYLRAVKTNTTTKACETALAGANQVNFAYECNNPLTCSASNLMSVNGGSATTIARNDNGSVSSYTPVNMTFDANGNAPFTFNYSDVGRVTLWANKTVNAAPLTGSSNPFVVKPGGFLLSNIIRTSDSFANPAAANATDPVFVKAGEGFTTTVTATTTTASGALTTPNYGKETTPETVKLTRALVAPVGGVPGGALIGTFGAFTNGVATGTTFTWNEVGIITLTPSVGDADYLGAGDTTGTTTGNIGRFIPDHFTLSAGALANRGGTCPGSIFTYLDEGLNLQLTLTAEGAGGGATQNYDGSLDGGGYAKLTPGTFPNYGIGARSGTTDLTSRITGAIGTPTPSWTSGELGMLLPALTASVTVVARTATPTPLRDGPWTGTQFGVAPSDSDGTQLLASALNLDVDNNAANDHQAVGAPTELRFGRLRLQNAYGSELLPLPIPMTVQYWNGTAFITNGLDSCTQLNTANIGFANYTPNLSVGETTPTGGPVLPVFNAGVGSLILSAPGPGNNGSVDLAINLGAAAADEVTCPTLTPNPGTTGSDRNYLRGQWCGGAYDKDPAARATFGVYKNPNEFIYLREMY